MYITDVTKNVSEIFACLEDYQDVSRMKFLLYVFNLLNNHQINNKNEANPSFSMDEENLIIFSLESIGFDSNACTIFLQYNILLYKCITNTNELYEENGNVMGLCFDDNEKDLVSKFERLSFPERLDVLAEMIIRYDNETYLKNRTTIITFGSYEGGFDIAYRIKKFKNNMELK